MPLDLEFVRSCFPAFSEPTLASTAFFENAGGSYACEAVIRRLDTYYRRLKVQPYGAYPASREAGEWMDESYRRLAPYLGVPEDWLHFGPSTSQNTYVLAQAFRRLLSPGDEIVVTNQDHEANSGVWRRLAADGVVVREWQVDRRSGHLDPADLARLLGPRTRLVCFPHCSNIVAEINPVAEIVAMVHAHGARCVVDAVSYAGHGLPDVGALGADAYLFSLYKTFGPHQGLMVIRLICATRWATRPIISTPTSRASASSRPVRIMRRWRPRRALPTTSTHSTHIITRVLRRTAGRHGCGRCCTTPRRRRSAACSTACIVARGCAYSGPQIPKDVPPPCRWCPTARHRWRWPRRWASAA
ncbi:MAG: aminotransferase class V-fold PLP-dependent enzyme [Rhodocyclaceae bacterium]